ncbi:ENR1 protein, partial [Pardalotus punctatus]|nr:ENR1 protein [Pardalotus punctatus]
MKVGKEDKILNGKNLVLDLVEHISKEFKVSNCWICGDTGMAEVWSWEGTALSPQEILKDQEVTWKLRSGTIGEECLWRRGALFTSKVGEMSCKRYLEKNGTHDWWIPKAANLYWFKERKERCTY